MRQILPESTPAPSLAFTTGLKRVRPEELRLLQRVNAFLRDSGSERAQTAPLARTLT